MKENDKYLLFEEAVNRFLKETDRKPEDIIVKKKHLPEGARPTGAEEIICAICCSIIAAMIWDGVKWIWNNYDHKCHGPSVPDEQPEGDRICPLCKVQIIPGKTHYCR